MSQEPGSVHLLTPATQHLCYYWSAGNRLTRRISKVFAESTADTGQHLGTPAYMAPEQIGADPAAREVGPACDVYALSATFYELFTGARLFQHDRADNNSVLTRKRKGEAPERPRSLIPDLPWEIETLVLGGLEREPKDRPSSAADLAADLRRFLANEPIRYKRPPFRRRVQLFYRRNRRVVNIVVPILLITLAVAGAFGVTAYQRGQKVKELGAAVKTEEEKRKGAEGKMQEADIEATKSKAAAATSERLKFFQEYIADMGQIPGLWKDAQIDPIRSRLHKYLRTDNGSLISFRQRIAQLPATSSTSASLSFLAVARALPTPWRSSTAPSPLK